MLDRVDDTIVAISSAPGYGALGIVRLSGPEAIHIADRMASAAAGGPLASRPGSTRVSGEVLIDATIRLPAVFYVFRAPHSYTRQDMVEIHTVGSPPALDLVRRRALDLGALAAEPGEFTARAFLNGAMDLASAEAVAGIIRAQTDTQLRASRRMMDGELSRHVRESRDTLAELVALVEADIDFAEEPIEFITPSALRDRLADIDARLQPLLQGEASAERLEVLPRILLFGPPNAGKSSLMNRLSGTSRAICAAAGGTTRDILSAPIRLGRAEAILLDTAGVDRSEDEIVAQARAMTLSEAERVDLICVVVDVTSADDEHLCSTVRSLEAPVVVAANKSDLVSASQLTDVVDGLKRWRTGPVCAVSAKDGSGIDMLRARFAEALGTTATTTLGEAVVLSERQRQAVRDASEAIQRAVELSENATETIDCADLLAFELREALDALGSVTGEVTTEDLLAQVFANFCIGK
jgi:tRNA modification GTPase